MIQTASTITADEWSNSWIRYTGVKKELRRALLSANVAN